MKKLKDVAAVIGSRVCTQLSAFVITPIAARHMSADEFGAWALILVVIGFGALFSDAGLGAYVVREQNYTREVRSTVFWMACALGAGIGMLIAALAAPVCGMLGIGSWTPALWILAISFAPQSVAAVLNAELRKEFRFGAILAIDVVNAVVMIAVAGGLLMMGYGLYSYVLANTIIAFTRMGWALFLVGMPAMRFKMASAKEATRFSGGLFGFNVINYWSRRLDDLLIGRFWGAAALGPYAIAYRLMMLPITEINRTLMTLIYPYLAPHQARPEKVRRDLLLVVQVIGALVTPAMTILWIARKQIIEVYLGPGWEAVAEILGVFALVGLLQALVNPLGVAYKVSGKTGTFFWMGIWNTGVTVVGALIGVIFGVYWVAIAYAVTNLVMLYPNIHIAFRSIGGGFWNWFCATWAWWIVPLASISIYGLISKADLATVTSILLCIGVVLPITVIVAFVFYRPMLRRMLAELTEWQMKNATPYPNA